MDSPQQSSLFQEPRWLETHYQGQGCTLIVGVDEAGRGPLAGPVVAASALLPTHHTLVGLDDSKRLTEKQRDSLFLEIHEQAIALGVGVVSAAEIDQLNILQASLKAMQLSLQQLLRQVEQVPDIVLVDGNQSFASDLKVVPVVKGDQRSQNIAAASIVAKVLRDRIMVAYHDLYPAYGFAKHKGYPTPTHKATLLAQGPTPVHRLTFRGVLPHDEESPNEPSVPVKPKAKKKPTFKTKKSRSSKKAASKAKTKSKG